MASTAPRRGAGRRRGEGMHPPRWVGWIHHVRPGPDRARRSCEGPDERQASVRCAPGKRGLFGPRSRRAEHSPGADVGRTGRPSGCHHAVHEHDRPTLPRRRASAACCARRRCSPPASSRAAGAITAAELRAVEDAAIADAVATRRGARDAQRHRRRVPPGVVPPRLPPAARRRRRHRQHRRQLRRRRHRAHDAAEAVGRRPPAPRPRHPGRRLPLPRLGRHRRRRRSSIPSPTMVHFRGGRAAIDIDAYPDLDVFFADLAACYRAEIDALYAAGCRYVQLDDTNLAYLCDPVMRAGRRRARRRPRRAAARLRRADQRVHRRPARRPHRRHPPVPRQLPQHLVRRRAATSPSPRCCSTSSTSTPTSSSTTTSAPATSPRCATCPPTRPSCSAWSPASGRSWSRSTSSPRRVDEAGTLRAARPAVPQPAVRLRQHRRGQRADRRPAVGQARRRRRRGRAHLALTRSHRARTPPDHQSFWAAISFDCRKDQPPRSGLSPPCTSGSRLTPAHPRRKVTARRRRGVEYPPWRM